MHLNSLTGSKISTSSTKFVFSGRSENNNGRHGLGLTDTFSTSIWNYRTEFKETWQEARSQLRSSIKFVFFGADRKTKMVALASDWLRLFFLLLLWTEFNETRQEAEPRPPLPTLRFGPIRKPSWPPLPLIGWVIFDFSSETAARNSWKLDRKQDLNGLYQVLCFSGRSGNRNDHHDLWLA